MYLGDTEVDFVNVILLLTQAELELNSISA